MSGAVRLSLGPEALTIPLYHSRELEGSLSALNAEHCEIVKQFVMAKIEREEIEAELVRYKLM